MGVEDHTLDTNVLNLSPDKNGKIALPGIIMQDMAAGMVAGDILEGTIKKSWKGAKSIGKQSKLLLDEGMVKRLAAARKAATKKTSALIARTGAVLGKESGDAASKLLLKKGLQKGVEETATEAMQKLASKATNKVAKKAAENAAKKAAIAATKKAASKAASKAGAKVATKLAAKMSAKGAAIGAGAAKSMALCAAGPVGCAAGAAMVAFNIAMAVIDILDTNNFNVLLDNDQIQDMAEMYYTTLEATYTDAGIEDPLDTEITFLPELFLTTTDTETGETVPDEKYYKIFNNYQDEYMKNNGFSDDWRGLMEQEDINDNVVLDSTENDDMKKKIIIGLVLIVIIILIINNNKNDKTNIISQNSNG